METLNKLLSINLNYIIIGLLVLFYSLEQLLKTQYKFKRRPQHLLNNILFQVVFFLGSLLWATVTVFSIEWFNNHHVGLFYLITVPLWLKLVLGVMAFDFVNYWFHRTAHIVPLLWCFHRVHHSDTTVDASTNFRGHPIEFLVYFGIGDILAAALFGLDLMCLGLFLLIFNFFFFLEHTNIKFPHWFDKSFGLVFVTPNIHKVHHEQDQYYTDSNFSTIFILWDRLFGTYKFKATDQINLGLKEFQEEKKQSFWYLIISPFKDVKRISSAELKKDSPVS